MEEALNVMVNPVPKEIRKGRRKRGVEDGRKGGKEGMEEGKMEGREEGKKKGWTKMGMLPQITVTYAIMSPNTCAGRSVFSPIDAAGKAN